MSRTSADRVAVIAGSTRGIGRGLVEALARHWGPAGLVYLTARGAEDGIAATAQLQAMHLSVDWLPFDLAAEEGPLTLAETLRSRHGGVDIAVLNGAFAPRDDLSAAIQARKMVETNNHGTLRFLNSFGPLMRENGRIVIIASGFGVLANLPDSLRLRFDTNAQLAAEIDRTMDDYVAAAEAGNAAEQGWPAWVNIPSKVGQVAVTRAFSKEHKTAGDLAAGVLINAACPGLTATDATRALMQTVFKGRTAQTVEDAARGLLPLLTLPPGSTEPYGELVRHGKVIAFGD